jgi:hypothetical protein
MMWTLSQNNEVPRSHEASARKQGVAMGVDVDEEVAA